MKKKNIFYTLIPLVILQGCFEHFEESAPIDQLIMETKQSVNQRVRARKIESVANAVNLDQTSLFYLQQGRDPFTPAGFFRAFFTKDSVVPLASKVRLLEDPTRPKGYKPGPFEKYDLNGINMIGVMSLANGETAALIDVGNNKIMMLRKGDYIGRDFGLVTDISEKMISIEEKFGSANRDDPDAWIVLPNKIDLRIK